MNSVLSLDVSNNPDDRDYNEQQSGHRAAKSAITLVSLQELTTSLDIETGTELMYGEWVLVKGKNPLLYLTFYIWPDSKTFDIRVSKEGS